MSLLTRFNHFFRTVFLKRPRKYTKRGRAFPARAVNDNHTLCGSPSAAQPQPKCHAEVTQRDHDDPTEIHTEAEEVKED